MTHVYINITQINAAIPGLGITGQFIIDELGMKPSRQEKRALFWLASEWPTICQRLTAHIAKGASTDITKLSGERAPPKARSEPAGEAFFDDSTPPADAGQGSDFFGESAPPPDDAGQGSDFFG